MYIYMYIYIYIFMRVNLLPMYVFMIQLGIP